MTVHIGTVDGLTYVELDHIIRDIDQDKHLEVCNNRIIICDHTKNDIPDIRFKLSSKDLEDIAQWARTTAGMYEENMSGLNDKVSVYNVGVALYNLGEIRCDGIYDEDIRTACKDAVRECREKIDNILGGMEQ